VCVIYGLELRRPAFLVLPTPVAHGLIITHDMTVGRIDVQGAIVFLRQVAQVTHRRADAACDSMRSQGKGSNILTPIQMNFPQTPRLDTGRISSTVTPCHCPGFSVGAFVFRVKRYQLTKIIEYCTFNVAFQFLLFFAGKQQDLVPFQVGSSWYTNYRKGGL
jgi:hypothetical protein